VTPFALTEEQLSPDREGVYLDPGAPPQLGEEGAEDYQRTFADVVRFSSVLDPDLSATIDISPIIISRTLGPTGHVGNSRGRSAANTISFARLPRERRLGSARSIVFFP